MPKYSNSLSRSEVMASSSLRALTAANSATRSSMRPRACPAFTDCEKEWMSWLRTSLSMKTARRRAASLEYSGSSAMSDAAVRMESSSNSLVVAPSYSPLMVRVATRSGSTLSSPPEERSTARTIFITSAGSSPPFRLRTCMVVDAAASAGVCSGVPALNWSVLTT